MKLKKNLILLTLAILISISSYSQYPQVKKIGNDSIVLITLKQGENINKQFSLLKDTVNILKNKLSSIDKDLADHRAITKLQYEQLNTAHSYQLYRANTYELKIDSLVANNKKNREMYEKYTKQAQVGIRHITVFATILGFLTVVFAAL